MVPVIVNAILNEHQLVIDIVAFVTKGDFHRSRLGEKQRGKILAGWVTRKMRTIAQYSIRDPNGQDAQMISEEPAGRMSMSANSIMRAGGAAPSLKGSVRAGSTLGLTGQMNNLNFQAVTHEPSAQMQGQVMGVSEMSALQTQNYPPSIPELSSLHDDKTPTDARPSFLPPLQQYGATNYSPVDARGMFNEDGEHPGSYQNNYHPQQSQYHDNQASTGLPDVLRPGTNENSAAGGSSHTGFYSDSTPYHVYGQQDGQQHGQQYAQDRRSFEIGAEDSTGFTRNGGYMTEYNDTSGGYESYSNQAGGGSGGGLRVANRDSSESGRTSTDDSWRQDALAQMNFIGAEQQQSQQGGATGNHHG